MSIALTILGAATPRVNAHPTSQYLRVIRNIF